MSSAFDRRKKKTNQKRERGKLPIGFEGTTDLPLKDSSLEQRKKEASQPLYLERYE